MSKAWMYLAAVLRPGGAARPRQSLVAAENVYGEVAQQLAGPEWTVTSILSNPDQDPHLFEASPRVARALAGAGIVVYNGVGYDPWMAKLLAPRRGRAARRSWWRTCCTGQPGSNPHLWYDPAAMPAYADALAAGWPRPTRRTRRLPTAPGRLPRQLQPCRTGSPPCAPSTPGVRSPRPSRCSARWRTRSAWTCATSASSSR